MGEAGLKMEREAECVAAKRWGWVGEKSTEVTPEMRLGICCVLKDFQYLDSGEELGLWEEVGLRRGRVGKDLETLVSSAMVALLVLPAQRRNARRGF